MVERIRSAAPILAGITMQDCAVACRRGCIDRRGPPQRPGDLQHRAHEPANLPMRAHVRAPKTPALQGQRQRSRWARALRAARARACTPGGGGSPATSALAVSSSSSAWLASSGGAFVNLCARAPRPLAARAAAPRCYACTAADARQPQPRRACPASPSSRACLSGVCAERRVRVARRGSAPRWCRGAPQKSASGTPGRTL